MGVSREGVGTERGFQEQLLWNSTLGWCAKKNKEKVEEEERERGASPLQGLGIFKQTQFQILATQILFGKKNYMHIYNVKLFLLP